ncbi:hypothetical protein FQN54_006028 [Arachnomyces sp. PD_36]|nr:hypothetical protein FQN54_006028 [Arachnomyces sp. PD_36]
MNRIDDRPQGEGIYMPDNNSPIMNVASDSIACNGPPVTGFTSSNTVIEVQAGSEITGAWLHELGSTGPDEFADNKVIASSHHGPVMAYLKKVPDATKNPSAGPGDGWFKISEVGYTDQIWGVDELIEAGGLQTVQIPECIEDGEYLLRFELIALHSASLPKQAQFYVECAQIKVTGGTGTAKPSTVSFPGAYSAEDPGILVQIWVDDLPIPESYTVPGRTIQERWPEYETALLKNRAPDVYQSTPMTGRSQVPGISRKRVLEKRKSNKEFHHLTRHAQATCGSYPTSFSLISSSEALPAIILPQIIRTECVYGGIGGRDEVVGILRGGGFLISVSFQTCPVL